MTYTFAIFYFELLSHKAAALQLVVCLGRGVLLGLLLLLRDPFRYTLVRGQRGFFLGLLVGLVEDAFVVDRLAAFLSLGEESLGAPLVFLDQPRRFLI